MPREIGQYGLSISVVKSAGSSSTGSLPCGSVDRGVGRESVVEVVVELETVAGVVVAARADSSSAAGTARIAIRLMPSRMVAQEPDDQSLSEPSLSLLGAVVVVALDAGLLQVAREPTSTSLPSGFSTSTSHAAPLAVVALHADGACRRRPA